MWLLGSGFMTPPISSEMRGAVISPAQCRAARAWLQMEQRELADLASCDRDTIRRLESDHHQLRYSTLANIKGALEARGIGFTFGRDGKPIGIEIRS
jgi:DNA-binding XRE family transcriptional regulator